MIKIYGSPQSSSGRCFLMLEELGLPYEVMPLDMRNKEHKSPEYLKLNPNGKVPCLIDGDFVMWESVAINFYLADKYRPELLGNDHKERARVQQWSIWSQTELQPPLVEILIQMVFVPEDKRDMNAIQKAKGKLPPMLAVLDKALEGKAYLLGSKISLADFNVASVANMAPSLQVALDSYPHLSAWLTKIRERPSFKKFSENRKR